MCVQTMWLLVAGLFLTCTIYYIIFFPLGWAVLNMLFNHPLSALTFLLPFFIYRWLLNRRCSGEGINPAWGISPSPTKLLLLAVECQCQFQLSLMNLYKKMTSYECTFEFVGGSIDAHIDMLCQKIYTFHYLLTPTYSLTVFLHLYFSFKVLYSLDLVQKMKKKQALSKIQRTGGARPRKQ